MSELTFTLGFCFGAVICGFIVAMWCEIKLRKEITKVIERKIRAELEKEKEIDFRKRKRMIELEVKGFSEKEIDMIVNYGYTEEEVIKIRDSCGKIKPSKQPPIRIGKVESFESVGGDKISDSVVQRVKN